MCQPVLELLWESKLLSLKSDRHFEEVRRAARRCRSLGWHKSRRRTAGISASRQNRNECPNAVPDIRRRGSIFRRSTVASLDGTESAPNPRSRVTGTPVAEG